jgi:hypothetical protein
MELWLFECDATRSSLCYSVVSLKFRLCVCLVRLSYALVPWGSLSLLPSLLYDLGLLSLVKLPPYQDQQSKEYDP